MGCAHEVAAAFQPFPVAHTDVLVLPSTYRVPRLMPGEDASTKSVTNWSPVPRTRGTTVWKRSLVDRSSPN